MQDNKKIGALIWKWLKCTVKWCWLLVMLLLGVLLYAMLPLVMFEYSYSLSELDVVETLFIISLATFSYLYIKLCRRIDAPLVRKIITPWVHQGCLFLVVILFSIIAAVSFKIDLDDLQKMPLLDLASYILMSLTLLYSYKRVNKYPNKLVANVETVTSEGAAG